MEEINMRGRTGTSTIYTTILPKQSYLNRICTAKLSKEANTCAFSAKKLSAIIKEDYPNSKFCIPAATIGRIIKRFHLFFHSIKQTTKRRVAKVKDWSNLKKRRPAGLKATKPREIIEFDMKHVYVHGRKYYAMCSIDPVTKEAYLHLSRTSSSHQAKITLMGTIKIFGKDIVILNDNGSENKGEAWKYLEEQEIVQYFAHPRAPKEKPFVERFIGSLQRECLDVYKEDIVTEEDLMYYVNRWLNNYHFLRPHQSLNYQTPAAYCVTMGITINRREVYMM